MHFHAGGDAALVGNGIAAEAEGVPGASLNLLIPKILGLGDADRHQTQSYDAREQDFDHGFGPQLRSCEEPPAVGFRSAREAMKARF